MCSFCAGNKPQLHIEKRMSSDERNQADKKGIYNLPNISKLRLEEESDKLASQNIGDGHDNVKMRREKKGIEFLADVDGIRYVVGRYPRFLRAHWKFLKTIVNKLFEFMHEIHPRVRIRNTNVTRIDQIDDNLTGFKHEPFTQILETNEEYEENDYIDVIGTVVGIGEIVAVNSIGSSKIRMTVVIEDKEEV
ncbi:hypothetical protein Tco_1467752, partial [Tanacetum coccineum]